MSQKLKRREGEIKREKGRGVGGEWGDWREEEKEREEKMGRRRDDRRARLPPEQA